MRWTFTTTLLVALGLALGASRAMAQQGSDPQLFDDLRTRLEQQDKQIQELQAQMAGLQQGATATTTQTAYAPPGGAVAANPGAAPGKEYEVGDDLSIKASMKDGLFLWLETPNKDFTMHLGAWMQLDTVWWNQTPLLATPAGARPGAAEGVAGGASLGGVGPLEDGIYFRRIRPFAEGSFWETGEYRLILAAENIQFDTIGLDEFWVGEKDIPVIGSVRVGHVKDPIGLEGDMTASSRCMTFMERSSYSEAIELNQNFLTGIWASNNYFDEHMTWEAMLAYPDEAAAAGAYFGNNQDACRPALRSCRSIKTRAASCCTWASPAVGGAGKATWTPPSPAATPAAWFSWPRSPNSATTTLPVRSCSPTTTNTKWSTPAFSPPTRSSSRVSRPCTSAGRSRYRRSTAGTGSTTSPAS